MKRLTLVGVLLLLCLSVVACNSSSAETAKEAVPEVEVSSSETNLDENDEAELNEAENDEIDVDEVDTENEGLDSGCDGDPYAELESSLYILPFMAGETFSTGLTNCSSSYHAPGGPDQYAFDFDMPIGTPFIAARAGTVYEMVDEEPSKGGGVGNYLIIDHGDGTYGLYYHSPENGFDVAIGDQVAQGDVLGETGRSGLAGYPHLHFIVVKGSPEFPYKGLPVSFRNVLPAHAVLQSRTEYEAVDYDSVE